MGGKTQSANARRRAAATLYLPDTVAHEYLVFDGLTRAGKGLVAPLVSNLERTEYAQINNPIDQIAIPWRLGLIDTRSAAAFLRVTVDGCTYEQAIGRNMNTRIGDISSIYRSLDARSLLARAVGEEGKAAMDRFNGQRRIATFITHFNLPMAELWFTAFPMLRIVVTVRHPVDVIASWQGRAWGERWGSDPLGFSLVAEVKGKPLPWFALDFADDYLAMSPIDRNAKCVLALDSLYAAALESLNDKKKQVRVVAFENFATRPMDELERLAAWLDTRVPPDMPVALARESVPRALPVADRRRKLDTLKRQIREDLFEDLRAASRDYEKRWSLEPVEDSA